MPQLRVSTAMPLSQARAAYGAAQRAVEMSSRGPSTNSSKLIHDPHSGDVCWEALETSSDDSEDVYADMAVDAASPHLWASAAGTFEPFAVEEQSTEVKYLREMYNKKVRGALVNV